MSIGLYSKRQNAAKIDSVRIEASLIYGPSEKEQIR
jgi:hypothetical protein